MTTTLRNVQFQKEIQSFKKGKAAVPAVALLYAMADLLKGFGPEWLQTDEARALLHSLNLAANGPAYKIDGAKEQARLEQVFE